MSADSLEKEVLDFISWLTPCGQISPGPSQKLIGREARKLLRKILAFQKRNGLAV